jgi:hypothetical protein
MAVRTSTAGRFLDNIIAPAIAMAATAWGKLDGLVARAAVSSNCATECSGSRLTCSSNAGAHGRNATDMGLLLSFNHHSS